jgi:hydrogenase-4 component F
VIWALVLVPALSGLLAFTIRPHAPRRGLLLAAAATHLALTGFAWKRAPGVPAPGEGWFALDSLGLLFLATTSVLFFAASVQAVGYLRRDTSHADEAPEEGAFFARSPEAVFTGCLLCFLATMTLVTVSYHFGLLWVAVEATTLTSAPLICFHYSRQSLEATWKYLVICSVGIALALLGNFFLATSTIAEGAKPAALLLPALIEGAPHFQPVWLKAGFLFLLVGYGTKMGLAPLHTWLPDAHSEAPSPVSALLSGALLNCAFLGILRAYEVCSAAGEAAFSRDLLVGFGLASMAIGAAFVLKQPDYKRLLAYSSVEHVGILALGVGIGGVATFGALLHSVNHSLAKALLFFVAGNILAAYGTKSVGSVQGVLKTLPVSGVLWIAGFLAITGTPPFGLFLSEFTILKGTLDAERWIIAIAYLVFLAVVFIGMATSVLSMAQGSAGSRPPLKERLLDVAAPAVLAAFVLTLGVWIPPVLERTLRSAAAILGGS